MSITRGEEKSGTTPVFVALCMLDAAMDSLSEREREQVARAFTNKYGNEISHDAAPDFTAEEWKVLRLLADGETTLGIGIRAHKGERTVSTHMRSMMLKMNAKSRAHLIAEAFRKGML